MAFHKGRGILFGGVHDVEATEEGIESEFFDLLYAWNIDRNRFFQMSLREPKAAGKKQQAAAQAARTRNRGKADEEDLLRNLALLEARSNGTQNNPTPMEIDKPADEDEEEKEIKPKQSLPVRFEMPHRRFNAQLTIQDDTLFIFGGTFERGDQEFTFNDMYAIDLLKMDGAREIFYNEPERWNDAMAPESDEEEDEDDEDESGDEDMEDSEIGSTQAPSTAPTEATEVTEATSTELDATQETEPSVQDSRPHPRPFESLREFFSRSSTEWQDILLSKITGEGQRVERSVKELRKYAFDLAEEKWWDCREEITALEDEQAEAGIGEVVSISNRGEAASGGRRR